MPHAAIMSLFCFTKKNVWTLHLLAVLFQVLSILRAFTVYVRPVGQIKLVILVTEMQLAVLVLPVLMCKLTLIYYCIKINTLKRCVIKLT